MRLRGNADRISSPYLLDHLDNPVDWWSWSDEAFAEARRRDVPVLVSIGYSACHWCHVMAHESFEDEPTARLLNESFVAIKVDREERPDVDAVYMAATVALTGQGGWPMTVFVDHDGRPFYAGTYYPPLPRHGMPSFRQVLSAVSDTWATRRQEVAEAAERIATVLDRQQDVLPAGAPPDEATAAEAVGALGAQYDSVRGGFGRAPKFPPSMVLEFLLRHYARTGNAEALRMVEGTGTAMARGGIYDQLGGGFARYSVDSDWVVPHFEKMLYDNALLLRAYLHWWRATGSPLAERVARETAAFLLRDLATPEGGFASALDADSEGAEGKYYVWTPEQLQAVLGNEDGRWAQRLLAVTRDGTFEAGTSVLQLRADPEDPQRWARVRADLLAARSLRIAPARDDKVVAAWNGMAIAALAEAGALLREPDFIEAAMAAADLLVAVHLGADGDEHGDRLARTSRDGRPGSSPGVLEDYACVADGFLALSAVTGEEAWLAFAGVLLDVVLQHFSDGEGGFFDTADDAPALVRRPQDPGDSATPSGWLAAAGALLSYAALTGSTEHRLAAERALDVVTPLAVRAPRGVGSGLAVAEALLDGPREVAVVGAAGDPRTAALWRTALLGTAPGAVVAVADPADDPGIALLRDRPLLAGAPAAYVCRGFACQAPTADPLELATAMQALTALL